MSYNSIWVGRFKRCAVCIHFVVFPGTFAVTYKEYIQCKFMHCQPVPADFAPVCSPTDLNGISIKVWYFSKVSLQMCEV